MSTTNFSSSNCTESFKELLCSPSSVGGLQQQLSICLLAVHILLSINPYPCCPSQGILPASAETTDLLVGLVTQPLYATYWVSLVQEHWRLCQYALDAGSVLYLVSLMTMTAISVDRLLALLSRLRYQL